MKKENLHKKNFKISNKPPLKSGFYVPTNFFDTIENTVWADIKASKFQKTIDNSFNTPKNYFNNLENKIVAKLKSEALQKNKSTSEIPDNYFDTLENRVFEKIKNETKESSFKNKLIKLVAPIAIAASLALIFVLNNNTKMVTFENLATSEIENWVENSFIDMDILISSSFYAEIDLDANYFSESLSDSDYIDYLSDEELELILYEN